MAQDGKPKHVFIFDNMKSRSHVFFQLFSKHPELHRTYHRYLNAHWGPDSILYKFDASEELRTGLLGAGISDTRDDCTKLLMRSIDAAEKEGKIFFANEHTVFWLRQELQLDELRGKSHDLTKFESNPFVFPDHLLEDISPVLLIRHPALQVSSMYRAMRGAGSCMTPLEEAGTWCTSLRWSRIIFDYFQSRGQTPIVVDGDDSLWRTEEMSKNVCEALGISPDGVSETWEPFTDEDMQHSHIPVPIFKAFLSAFYQSKGVERPGVKVCEVENGAVVQNADHGIQPGPPSIEDETKKLAKLYGDGTAGELRQQMERNMPDYEYLVKFKV